MLILLSKPHSVVDIITNSSTEIFTIDDDRDLELIRDMIYEMEKKYPNVYGHKLHVNFLQQWQLNEIFNVYSEPEDMISYLKALGYKVEPPEVPIVDDTKYIAISAERGGMDQRLVDFINRTFNVIDYTSEG